MTPKKFLQKELNALAAAFPHIHIRYGFDVTIDTHIIQLDPIDEYYHNEALDKAWIAIAVAFDEQFDDYISFVSSDSPLKPEVAEMEWKAPYKALVSMNDSDKVMVDA